MNQEINEKEDLGSLMDFITIDDINFFGPSEDSPNGKYTVAWSDAPIGPTPEGIIGGYRESGNGLFLLLEGKSIIIKGEAQRPNEGHVANNGNFIIADWMFGPGLKGTFFAIDIKGNIKLKHKFNANIYNMGLSPSGEYAVVQTAHNQYEGDGFKLFLFNINSKELLWKIKPIMGWGDLYEFDENNQTIQLIQRSGLKYTYTFKGELLEDSLWTKENINNANGYDIYSLVQIEIEKLDNTDSNFESYGKCFELLDSALNKDISDYTKAKTRRLMGEVCHKHGKDIMAIKYFEDALKYDSKIGVKRVYNKLRKDNDFYIENLSKDVNLFNPINCPECGIETPDDGHFCQNCGTKLNY